MTQAPSDDLTRALIFDCDGVLVDSERIYVEVERSMLRAIGLDYDLATFQRRFIGLSNADFRAALADDHAKLGLGTFPTGFWDRHHHETWRRFEAELQPPAGASAFVAALAGDKAVASSSTVAELARKLAFVGLDRHFGGHVYSAELVRRGKPAPDLFLYAAERLARPPGDCIVIEDSENGVRAGVAAGMEVWGFVGGGHAGPDLPAKLAAAGAAAVMSDYAELERRWRADYAQPE